MAPEVIESAARGDPGAWRELVSVYGRRLFALARSRMGDSATAEDLVQSVMVTVAVKLREGAYSERGSFEAWLFRIAMNRIRDGARRAARHGVAAKAAALETLAAGPHEGGEDPSTLQRLREALERLPEADREIVEMRHHADLSFKTMAELTGEPLGTLLARHHRALRKLRAMLEPAEKTGGGNER